MVILAKKVILSQNKKEKYEWTAEMIAFFRRNPSIACEYLLNVPLMDSQVWILDSSWNARNIMWTCSRGFGKSFLIGIFAMLKALLYPETDIYIISKSGNQAKETFEKMEKIAKGELGSIKSKSDIFLGEVEKSRNSDGFVKDPSSHRVRLKNGSTIYTLNSNPDNIRGKRARVLIYDESSFIDDELIIATEPFLSQSSDFVLSTEEGFEMEAEKRRFPNQVIYASSAGDEMSKHAKNYKIWSKKMLAGDNNYFCCDIPVTEPLNPYRKGKPIPTMMDKKKYENAMATNPIKAQREYYNKFDTDGGEDQIVKPASIRRNETFDLPVLESTNDKERYVMAFDPAHQNDRSIITVMRIKRDEEKGYYGEIVNCVNLFDSNNKKNLKFSEQKDEVRKMLVDYSTGAKMDYEGIDALLIDAGSGGGGTLYADELLESWTDGEGIIRRGLIDREHKAYKSISGYGDNKDILKLVQPKDKKTMITELITLMKMDMIKFNKSYSDENVITVENSPGEYERITLAFEERLALIELELLKTETTSMRKYGESYEIQKDRQGKLNDDRFDTLVMLAHYLYNIRKDETVKRGKKKRDLRDYFFATKASI